jgi:heme exporter protein D
MEAQAQPTGQAPAQNSGTQQAVDASMLASPTTIVSPVPNANEMAEGGETAPETTNDGSHDFGQWVAIGIIALTIVSLVMNIYTNRKAMLKLDKDDADARRDINELKLNVKKQMGDKYESLA